MFLEGTLSFFEGDKFNLTCRFTERNPSSSTGPYIFRLDEEITVLYVSDKQSNLIRDPNTSEIYLTTAHLRFKSN